MKIVAISQARMGSTRLPGKVLADLAGEPLLVRHVRRVQRAEKLDQVVIATTTESADDAIVDICNLHGWSCFRGDENDVLDRYFQAACEHDADVIVRVTSDCPLIEPQIIDNVIGLYLEAPEIVDYTSNVHPRRTFPRGLDVELVRFAALKQASLADTNPAWREHVTVYVQRHPELFTPRCLTNEIDHSYMRWTVDTLEDLTLVRKIYNYFGHDGFHWREVFSLLRKHPEWLEINSHIEQKIVV